MIGEMGWKVGMLFDIDKLMWILDKMNWVNFWILLIVFIILMIFSYFLVKMIIGLI